jgi:hypothetical protein
LWTNTQRGRAFEAVKEIEVVRRGVAPASIPLVEEAGLCGHFDGKVHVLFGKDLKLWSALVSGIQSHGVRPRENCWRHVLSFPLALAQLARRKPVFKASGVLKYTPKQGPLSSPHSSLILPPETDQR